MIDEDLKVELIDVAVPPVVFVPVTLTCGFCGSKLSIDVLDAPLCGRLVSWRCEGCFKWNEVRVETRAEATDDAV